MNGLTAVIITLNEEDNIARCLHSVGFCQETLVVDGGSTDRTVEIARELGARVIENVEGGRSEQRQVGLENVRTPWFLTIDADEEVGDYLRDEICRFLENPGSVDGCEIPMQHFFLNRWIEHCDWWFPDYKTRLMKTNNAFLTKRLVHESVACSGTSIRLQGILHHYAHQSLYAYLEKMNRYTSQDAQQLLLDESELTTAQLVRRMFSMAGRRFYNMYVRGRGWKDGMAGFLLCGFSAWYEIVIFAKYWEQKHAASEKTNSRSEHV